MPLYEIRWTTKTGPKTAVVDESDLLAAFTLAQRRGNDASACIATDTSASAVLAEGLAKLVDLGLTPEEAAAIAGTPDIPSP